MMESKEFLIPSENDESIGKTSLALDSSQPKFDSLLDKLRKGMSELTSKGDDFTKQMFQMYNTLEDIVHSSKMNDNDSQALDQVFVTNKTNSIDKISKINTLKNSVINSDENGFKSSNQSFNSSIDSNDTKLSDYCNQNNNNNEIIFNNNMNSIDTNRQKTKNDSPMNSINESIISLNTFCSNTSLNVSDSEQNCNNNNNNNNNINNSFNQLVINSKSDSIKEKIVLKEPKEQKTLCLDQLDKTNGYINRNSINNSEHIVNPLLDTINSLTSCSDSSDECDVNKKCYTRGERHRRILNGSRHLNRKSCNYYYSSSDGDSIADYTGTNSLESGYKSDYLGSNTPEVIDGSSVSSFGTAFDGTDPSVLTSVAESVNQAISHQMTANKSLNSLKKSALKQTTNNLVNNSSTKSAFDIKNSNNSSNSSNSNICHKVLSDNQKQQKSTSDDISSNASVESLQTTNSSHNNNRKTVGMFSEKIANRLKAFNNDSQLEHLLKLRKSLLKALKRCEQISSPANSRDGSPITAGIPVTSRSSSPATSIVKSSQNAYNCQTSTSLNSRRLRDEISCGEKSGQKSVSSPLTTRADEEINDCEDSNQMLAINSLKPTSNTSANASASASSNNNSNATNPKSVRFNSSVKISSVNSNPTQVLNRKQITGNYVSNKSILKDPLCETLRTAIKAGEFKNNCSLEGEIDELLYGRTGAYYYSPQMATSGHFIDDCMNPTAAYVTMIEEKYRTFTANTCAGSTGKQTIAANSKKSASNAKDYSALKTGFSSSMSAVSSLSKAHEIDSDLITTQELRINATLSSTTTARPKSSPYSIYGTTHSTHSNHSGSSYGSTKTNRKSTKTHFTEMAKCMLEILDDLQVPQKNDATYKHSSTRLQNSLLMKKPETESIDLLMKELSIGQSDTSDLSDISSISYRTLPEQHIYEEILYDCVESQPKDSKLYGHYVPSRRAISSTVNTFAHSSVNCLRVDAPIHQSHIRHVGSWGRTSNKPKQRSNLYTIFSDESERRNISRSLEREFCKRKANDFNPSNACLQSVDNYGSKLRYRD